MPEAGATDLILIVAFALSFAILVSRRLRHSGFWPPMVTPLASIIGSGFLVSVPLLASHLGLWSVAAIAGLCLLAWWIGGAIRYNIAHAEGLVDRAHPGWLRRLERASHLVLAGAYFISVTYYLALLGAFVVKISGAGSPAIGTGLASLVVLAICATGIWRGLEGVERAEKFTVGANLAAIAALLVMLSWRDAGLSAGAWASVPGFQDGGGIETLRFLMGLLIVVQGFETTRFMGDLYDAKTRIAAMRRAQLVASAVYLAFFVLMIPLYGQFRSETDVAGFIGVIGIVSPWLPMLMVMGAVASQFSAAVADSIGASELVADLSGNRVGERAAYWLIGAAALGLLWLTDVIGLVALASRAFALFYALQCAVASLVARRAGEAARAAWFAVLALACLAIAVLGVPAAG